MRKDYIKLGQVGDVLLHRVKNVDQDDSDVVSFTYIDTVLRKRLFSKRPKIKRIQGFRKLLPLNTPVMMALMEYLKIMKSEPIGMMDNPFFDSDDEQIPIYEESTRESHKIMTDGLRDMLKTLEESTGTPPPYKIVSKVDVPNRVVRALMNDGYHLILEHNISSVYRDYWLYRINQFGHLFIYNVGEAGYKEKRESLATSRVMNYNLDFDMLELIIQDYLLNNFDLTFSEDSEEDL